MTAKIIFSVLLFILICNSAMAATETYIWEEDESASVEYTLGLGTAGYEIHFNQISTNDIDEINGLYFASVKLPIVYGSQFTDDSEYSSVNFMIGSNVLGSGIAGYSKGTDYIFINYWVQHGGLDTTGYSGNQRISVSGMSGSYHSIRGNNDGCGYRSRAFVPYQYYNPHYYSLEGSADIDFRTNRVFCNEIVIEDENGIIDVNITRSVGNTSKFIITDPSVLVNETSLQSDGIITATVNSSVNIYGINYADSVFDYTYYNDAVYSIDFNQSFYTNPELVGVEYDIDGFDLTNNEYYIEILGRNTHGVEIGVNVEYIELSDSTGEESYTIDKQWLSLPMDITAYLYRYDKNTGTSLVMAATDTVSYNPESIAPGSVWTNKESYNTTEVVTIYIDTENGGGIELWLRDDLENLHEWYRIGSGQTSIKHLMQKSHVGTWDVYLFEEDVNGNDAITNQTVFTVLADEDTAYFNWWNSPIYKGEPASYDYIATSNNSIIKIYDGTGNKLYEFNATEGYNTGQITTTTGTVGNWTGSLYDNGTYYNSSLEVESSNSWVRFDRTDYYIEDTIQIEYFIVSQDHAIVLRDADDKIVLKWMPGTFMAGQRGTLDYTLIEDNEWGHDVQTQLWNGYITAGLWYIGYEDINYLIGYPDSYDEATVHNCYDKDRIGGGGGTTQGDGSLIGEFTALAELAGFRGEVGLFILSILIIIITSVAMLISKFPVPGVLCIDILQFFAFIGIGFIPILYLILFGVVAGLIVFGTIFFRKAG